MTAIVIVFGVLLILSLISYGIYIAVKPKNDSSNNTTVVPIKDNQPSFITPKPFRVGYLSNPPQKLANLCSNVMYPINPPYVDYGADNTRKCDSLIFNSPP